MTTRAGIIVRRAFVPDLPWEAFAAGTAVAEKVLWSEGRAKAAILVLEPDAEIPLHRHRRDVHHIWVIAGSCELDGSVVPGSSYLFIPAGAEHGARASVMGCTLFYLTLPSELTK